MFVHQKGKIVCTDNQGTFFVCVSVSVSTHWNEGQLLFNVEL